MTNKKLFLASAVLFCPSLLLAWSENGHRIVGQIAQDQLAKDPGGANALAAIQDILGAAYGPNALANLAPCADFVRHLDDEGQPVANSGETINCGGLTLPVEPQSEPWHFVNVPVTDSADSVANDCGSGCVISAIKNAVSVLQTSTVQADRQKQLMYLVHFVGDAHQPLHCTYAVLKDGSPDRGGNCEHVRFGGKTMAFHAFWDHRLNATDPPNWQSEAQRLEGSLPAIPTVTDAGALATQAATESFEDGHDILLEFLQLPNASAQTCAKGTGVRIPSVVLPEGYQGEYSAKVDERLQMAGVRLAALLKLALGANSQAPRIISRRVAP